MQEEREPEPEPEIDDSWDDTSAREQGNAGEDTANSDSPDYGADKD
jgi:hypothetical protein